MPTAYERHLIATCLTNASKRFPHWDRQAVRLAKWLIDPDNSSGFAGRRLISRLNRANIDPDAGISAQQWRCLQPFAT